MTAIAILGALFEKHAVDKVLIVAPTSVVGVWPRELDQYADFQFRCAAMLGTKNQRIDALNALNGRYDYESESIYAGRAACVAVINYESVWRDGIFEELCKWKPDMIIADESQRIKSHDAQQSKAMHQLGDIAKYKLILSGTPVQNSSIDLWSQYRFMQSGIFGKSFYGFRAKYAVMGGFNKKQIVGYRNTDELIKKEHSAAYRVTKAECLDLPEQTFENRYIALPKDVERLYKQIKRQSYAELEDGGTVTASTVLTKLIRLQQLTGGFLREDDTDRVTQIHTAKLDALMEIIKDCRDAGQKVVVFARFTAEIDLIADALKKEGIGFGMIDGRTPMQTETHNGQEVKGRSEIVEDFQTNPETMVFVAQIQTAGLGITLHAASIDIFYSLDFSYGNYSQALSRIHRIGQKWPVTHINLVCENTIDEDVIAALKNKDDLASKVVDGWRALFGGE